MNTQTDNTNVNPVTDELEDLKTFKFGFGSKAEEEKKRAYVPYAADFYVAECVGVEFVKGTNYRTGEEEDQIEVNFKLLRTIEGNPVLDMNGEVPKSTFFKIKWLNPDAVFYNKKTGEPHRTRALFTAILGIPVDAGIPEFTEADCLGRKIKMYIDVVGKDDKKNNKADKFHTLFPK